MTFFSELERFWSPGAEFTKKTGMVAQGGVAPLASPLKGLTIVEKMFGVSRIATAAAVVAKTGISKWVYVGIGGAGLAGYGLGELFGGKKEQKQDLEQSQKINQELLQLLKQSQEQTSKLAQDIAMRIDPVITQPQTTTITSILNQYDYSTQTNIIKDSPFGSIDSKKDMSLKARTTASGEWSTPISGSQDISAVISQLAKAIADQKGGIEAAQRQDATQGIGTDMTIIAVVAAVAVIGHGYFTSRKPDKRR